MNDHGAGRMTSELAIRKYSRQLARAREVGSGVTHADLPQPGEDLLDHRIGSHDSAVFAVSSAGGRISHEMVIDARDGAQRRSAGTSSVDDIRDQRGSVAA